MLKEIPLHTPGGCQANHKITIALHAYFVRVTFSCWHLNLPGQWAQRCSCFSHPSCPSLWVSFWPWPSSFSLPWVSQLVGSWALKLLQSCLWGFSLPVFFNLSSWLLFWGCLIFVSFVACLPALGFLWHMFSLLLWALVCIICTSPAFLSSASALPSTTTFTWHTLLILIFCISIFSELPVWVFNIFSRALVVLLELLPDCCSNFLLYLYSGYRPIWNFVAWTISILKNRILMQHNFVKPVFITWLKGITGSTKYKVNRWLLHVYLPSTSLRDFRHLASKSPLRPAPSKTSQELLGDQ